MYFFERCVRCTRYRVGLELTHSLLRLLHSGYELIHSGTRYGTLLFGSKEIGTVVQFLDTLSVVRVLLLGVTVLHASNRSPHNISDNDNMQEED